MEHTVLQQCPLCAKVEFILGAESMQIECTKDSEENSRRRGLLKWQKAISAWKRLAAYMKDHTQQENSGLGVAQFTSWSILSEWLRGDYQPEVLAQAARDCIEAGNYEMTHEYGVYRATFAADVRTGSSLYQYYLANLFVREFVDYPRLRQGPRRTLYFEVLASSRRQALEHATMQRMAHGLYSVGVDQRQFADVCYQQRPRANLMACPWLTQTQKTLHNPCYLWDIEVKHTIKTSELDRVPEYTCISHTWGRWMTGTPVIVEGVPWKVPQNAIFNVKDLPDTLYRSRQHFTTKHLWFDLFCLPQDFEDVALAEIGRREISRQASIFSRASSCVIWFNYIDSWEAEQHTIDWLSNHYLRISYTPGFYYTEECYEQTWAAAEKPLQLLQNPQQEQYLGKMSIAPPGRWLDSMTRMALDHEYGTANWEAPSPWFSSLWTLQEAYLCPSMILMNRNWEALGDRNGQFVTLDHLFSLASLMTGLETEGKYDSMRTQKPSLLDKPCHRASWPVGGLQLLCLNQESLLYNSLYRTRNHVLVQGNIRQCLERRAQAIMSVVGITDWFLPTREQEEELVLGMYPLKFVQEAAQKIGADFYLTEKDVWSLVTDYHEPRYGTMLPFEPLDQATHQGKQRVDTIYQAAGETHPAISTWTITKTGSVWIRQAPILASSDLLDQHLPWLDMPVALRFQAPLGERESKLRVNLYQWISEQSDAYCIYAVTVSREFGIILQGLREGVLNPQRLVKVGSFDIWRDEYENKCITDWILAQVVNWIVM